MQEKFKHVASKTKTCLNNTFYDWDVNDLQFNASISLNFGGITEIS